MITDFKKYNHEYYLKNKKRIIENVMKWKEKNPEKIKKYTKKSNNSIKTRLRKDKWIENNKEKNRVCKGEWRKRDYHNSPIKHLARNLSQQIELKPCCDICGSTENLERHHWDYNKPLLVNTLCKTCHQIQHIKHFSQSKFGGNILGR